MPMIERSTFWPWMKFSCADADRGHVFTDRLLHARGRQETMFMGSDAFRSLLTQLVPEAEI